MQAHERGALDASRWPGVAIAALSGLLVAGWLLRSRGRGQAMTTTVPPTGAKAYRFAAFVGC